MAGFRRVAGQPHRRNEPALGLDLQAASRHAAAGRRLRPGRARWPSSASVIASKPGRRRTEIIRQAMPRRQPARVKNQQEAVDLSGHGQVYLRGVQGASTRRREHHHDHRPFATTTDPSARHRSVGHDHRPSATTTSGAAPQPQVQSRPRRRPARHGPSRFADHRPHSTTVRQHRAAPRPPSHRDHHRTETTLGTETTSPPHHRARRHRPVDTSTDTTVPGTPTAVNQIDPTADPAAAGRRPVSGQRRRRQWHGLQERAKADSSTAAGESRSVCATAVTPSTLEQPATSVSTRTDLVPQRPAASARRRDHLGAVGQRARLPTGVHHRSFSEGDAKISNASSGAVSTVDMRPCRCRTCRPPLVGFAARSARLGIWASCGACCWVYYRFLGIVVAAACWSRRAALRSDQPAVETRGSPSRCRVWPVSSCRSASRSTRTSCSSND